MSFSNYVSESNQAILLSLQDRTFKTGNNHRVAYRISSNKRPRRLLSFETVRCGAY